MCSNFDLCNPYNIESAECVFGTNEAVEKLQNPWLRMAREGKLPPTDQMTRYKVYSCSSDKLGRPITLVFSQDERNFIHIGLLIQPNMDGPAKCFAASGTLRDDLRAKLRFRGEITISGNKILSQALNVISSFGNYNKTSNNCQDFANVFLKSLGIDNPIKTDRRTLLEIAGGVVAGAVALGAIILGGRR